MELCIKVVLVLVERAVSPVTDILYQIDGLIEEAY